MTRNSRLLLVLLAACGPEQPAGTGTTADDTAGTTTADTGSSTAIPTTGSESSTGLETTGAASSSSTGEEPLVCAWLLPGNDSFCPLLTMPNIDMAGDTPMGPVTFRYAYFGLNVCNCPEPTWPSVGLFAEAQSFAREGFVGDHMILEGVRDGSVKRGHGEIAGQFFKVFDDPAVDASAIMTPSMEQTTPPLDPAAPPQVSGELVVSGEGWAIAGSFTAPLCTALDWTPSCG